MVPSIFSAVKQICSLLTVKEKWQFFKMFSLSLCTSILEMMTATSIVLLAQVLNNPETGRKYIKYLALNPTITSSQIIMLFAVSIGVIYLLKNCLAAIEVYFQHFSIQGMNYRFKKKLLEHYAHADYNFYLTRNSSQGYAVIASDTEHVFSSGMVSLAQMFSELIIFISLISLIVYMQPILALFVFGIGSVFSFVLMKGIFPLFYRWGKVLQELSLQGDKNLLQFFHGFKEIVLIGKREAFINKFAHFSEKRSKTLAIQNFTNILPRMVTEVLFVTLFVAAIIYFCLSDTAPQQMIGILGGYLYLGFRLMPGLNRVIMMMNTFKSVIPCVERVSKEYKEVSLDESLVDCPELTFHHSLVIERVHFHYLNVSQNALSDINLLIRKGECLGIIGETGSGKSTLADLILGLLRPQHGSILVDGLYPVNSKQWHDRIGYVQQSFYLIDDSIKANVAFGVAEEEIDLKQLDHVIRVAQLDRFIAQLPLGIETIVGERGVRLSGGERQRIAIARALYRKPDVFIFDEATSALDNETEERLMQTIESIQNQDTTVILIAHRLSTLKKCDRIVVIKRGTLDKIITYQTLQENSMSV